MTTEMDAELSAELSPVSTEMAEALQALRSHLTSGQPLYRTCKRFGIETYEYSPELRRGWTALEQGPLPLRFDWPQWQAQAKALEANPSLIAQADPLTLRKLLTFYLRQERFVAGTLAQIADNGQLLRILQRLAALEPS